ncbi:MAG: redoxin family protein [Deltaproteobacteria bacterium]|nr:redoxin family protein [Deltaproteobacteria bacterium]
MIRCLTLASLVLALPLMGCSPSPANAEAAAKESVAPTAAAPGAATLGEAAPDFTLNDLDGTPVSLSDSRGKTVVIEWFNPDCPFVKYAHGRKGPLRTLAATHAENGIVWLAVNSGAPGKQGAGLERNKKAVVEYAMDHPVLLDESGVVGKAYSAKTTPHMFVVNEAGVLVYAGALDNAPLGNSTGATQNYVDAALADLSKAGAVSNPSPKPYGCSVKYGS